MHVIIVVFFAVLLYICFASVPELFFGFLFAGGILLVVGLIWLWYCSVTYPKWEAEEAEKKKKETAKKVKVQCDKELLGMLTESCGNDKEKLEELKRDLGLSYLDEYSEIDLGLSYLDGYNEDEDEEDDY